MILYQDCKMKGALWEETPWPVRLRCELWSPKKRWMHGVECVESMRVKDLRDKELMLTFDVEFVDRMATVENNNILCISSLN